MNDNDNANQRKDSTVVLGNTPTSALSPDKTVMQAKPKTATDERKTLVTKHREEALTRFYSDLKDGDNTERFGQAKKVADAALAANKIILNKRFVLESVIGVGGMGTVYLAKDLRKIEADDAKPYVAVKVLNENFKKHPDAFVTLQREASRSHALSHPNIVTVHDFDRDGDVIYMTMEYLEGEPLDNIIQQFPSGMPMARALPIIRGFVAALIHAHSKGIIHSDLKPGNIFATKNSAKVLDFGIARSVNSSSTNDSFDAGSLGALTPAYATLEMFEGSAPHATDDIYAAAIITYQIVTGKHPFDGLSSKEAVLKGLKPAKPASLNKYQWQALESALALHKKNRTQSIKEFIQRFTYVKKVPYFKILSAALFVAITGLGLAFYLAPNDVAIAIDNAYEKAKLCSNNNDIECAIEASKAVLELSPGHKKATELLTLSLNAKTAKTEQTLTVQMANCTTTLDQQCAQNALASLQTKAPKSPLIKDFKEKIKTIENTIALNELMTDAKACKAEGNYECATKNLLAAAVIDPENTSIKTMRLEIDDIIRQNDSAAANKNKLISDHINKAESCLSAKKYDCAISAGQAVLNIDQNNSTALSLKQKAEYAKAVAIENTRKAEKLMSKAESCFDSKNYSCAVTNSESALEFISEYKPALEMINKSKERIKQLKTNFKIN